MYTLKIRKQNWKYMLGSGLILGLFVTNRTSVKIKVCQSLLVHPICQHAILINLPNPNVVVSPMIVSSKT